MAVSRAPAVSSEDLASSFVALDQLLDQFVDVLMGLGTETYCATPVPGVSGSVGGHTRHALDHVSAFLSARSGVTLSYDCRERGTAVERDPAAALRQILRVKVAIASSVGSYAADEPLWVTSQIDCAGHVLAGWSTIARELSFVISHTVHHQALVAVLLACQGIGVPDRFGYAPSTPSPTAG